MYYRKIAVPTQLSISLSRRLYSHSNEKNLGGFLPHVINQLNYSLNNYPMETICTLIGSELISIYGMYSMITLSGMEISPEFALAFGISRPLRRLRAPLDFAAAGVIAKAFPITTTVQFSALTNAIPMFSQDQSKQPSRSLLEKGANYVKSAVDKYGAAYFIGSRLVGFSTVSLLYMALKQGIDLQPFLTALGIEEAGNTLGTWAGAVVMGGALYPLSLGATGYIAPAIGKALKK